MYGTIDFGVKILNSIQKDEALSCTHNQVRRNKRSVMARASHNNVLWTLLKLFW